jgi:hypothetical protein
LFHRKSVTKGKIIPVLSGVRETKNFLQKNSCFCLFFARFFFDDFFVLNQEEDSGAGVKSAPLAVSTGIPGKKSGIQSRPPNTQ